MYEQYAVFKLGNERYGVDVLNVSGISDVLPVNKIPNVSENIEGLMSVRGDIVPIINLKKKFAYEDKTYGNDARVILMNINDMQIGFLVDSTSQMRVFGEDNIESVPSLIVSEERDYMKGIGKHDGKIYILLHEEKLISDMEKIDIGKIGDK